MDELVKRIAPSDMDTDTRIRHHDYNSYIPPGVPIRACTTSRPWDSTQDTFNAQVEGTIEGIASGNRRSGPGNLTISSSKLTGVGANRSAGV